MDLTPDAIVLVTFWVLAAVGTVGAIMAVIETIRAGGKRY